MIRSAKTLDYNPTGMLGSSCLEQQSFFDEIGEVGCTFSVCSQSLHSLTLLCILNVLFLQDAIHFMMPVPWSKSLDIVDSYTGWTPREFSDMFFDEFQYYPPYYAASAFADGEILVAAIEQTQSLDHLTIANAMRSMHFPTLYGNITFDSNNQAQSDFYVVQVQKDLSYELVFPSSANNATLVYPMPTWAGKECSVSTGDCSGHGVCDSKGNCTCDPGYYGSAASPDSCDALCFGDLATDNSNEVFCKENTYIYIGGIVPYGIPEAEELTAMIKLAVQMVNNNTDGWFDNAKQISIISHTIEGKCSEDDGYADFKKLLDFFSTNHSAEFSGTVGTYCSSARYTV